MAQKGLKVVKFGGTSMGLADAMKRVILIIRKPQKDARIRAVVVSAMSGVTDELIRIAHAAASQEGSHRARLRALEERHLKAVGELISSKNRKRANAEVRALFEHLTEVVTGIALIKELSPGALDYCVSYGERLSAHILADALNDRGVKCEYLNARNVVVTDDNFGEAAVQFVATNRAIKNYFKTHPKLQIVTGFIGATRDRKTTTLGRGGSDYSASIFGAALSARVIEIWTDVSGVMTADPRKVHDAKPIPEMTYQEAIEMSYFGAKVIHPPTMRPAQVKGIPLVIKNTFQPEARGTLIIRHANKAEGLVRGISSFGGVAMLQVQGNAILGSRGGSDRIFAALARAHIALLLITQASSQNSISFAVREKDVERARAALRAEFVAERASNLVEEVKVTKGLSIIAIVGEGMRHRTGVSGRLFGTLGKNGVNIVAIAQGSSELNISVVVSEADETKALNAIHTGFFFPEMKPIHLFLMGTGLIGSTLLRQIAQQRAILKREHGFDIRVAAIANSKKMLFDHEDISLEKWQRELERSSNRMNLKKFIEAMKRAEVPAKVFVDCTASEDVARAYAEILSARISVVTPNKRANSSEYSYFKKLGELAKEPGVSFLYETNACAALPLISMIDDLVLSGDRIRKIEGILSGTMSYIFNQFAGTKSFSESVAEAKRFGYTEPDPREDLNGMDVARKILILARKAGFALELSDVKVESLLSPAAARAKTVDDFFKRLKKEDTAWKRKKSAAEKKGQHLRYIATLEKGTISVKVRAVALPHPFYEMSGSDNIVTIHSDRYAKTPLLIQGPGAGGEVTAAGVFADILRVARDAA